MPRLFSGCWVLLCGCGQTVNVSRILDRWRNAVFTRFHNEINAGILLRLAYLRWGTDCSSASIDSLSNRDLLQNKLIRRVMSSFNFTLFSPLFMIDFQRLSFNFEDEKIINDKLFWERLESVLFFKLPVNGAKEKFLNVNNVAHRWKTLSLENFFRCTFIIVCAFHQLLFASKREPLRSSWARPRRMRFWKQCSSWKSWIERNARAWQHRTKHD